MYKHILLLLAFSAFTITVRAAQPSVLGTQVVASSSGSSTNQSITTPTLKGSGGETALTVSGTNVAVNGAVTANAISVASLSVAGKNVNPTNVFILAFSDETTAIVAGTSKLTFRAPFAFTVIDLRLSVSTASSSGGPLTVDINESGTTIISTKLSVDDTEKTSTSAATPYVLSDSSIADDAEITIDVDTSGTGAKGGKVYIYYTR